MSDDEFITGTITFRQPKQVSWEPQPDITAYELALCLPIFVAASHASFGHYIEDRITTSLPAEAQRHFKISDR